MNINKKIILIAILTIFIVGCSHDTSEIDVEPKKANQEKMMAKVQNDINEIIGKDYKFVIENMGSPYKTTYYIDIDDLSSRYENYTSNFQLVYPKEVELEGVENTALYINFDEEKVVDVQNDELETTSEEYENKNYNVIDFIVEKYQDEGMVSEDIKKLKDNNEELEKILKDKAPYYYIYSTGKDNSLSIYIGNMGESDEFFIARENNNGQVEDIQFHSKMTLTSYINEYLDELGYEYKDILKSLK